MLEWRDLFYLQLTLDIGLQHPSSVENYNPDRSVCISIRQPVASAIPHVPLEWLDDVIWILLSRHGNIFTGAFHDARENC